jgi:hypothetical protein
MVQLSVLNGREARMNIEQKRILFRTADILITLTAIFFLLYTIVGFTRHQEARAASPRLGNQDTNYTNLSTTCTGGFSNQRTVGGKTQIASRGAPFNAYQLTFTNSGNTIVTIYGVTVDLANYQHHVFARPHDSNVGNGAGITLGVGQTRQIVETAGATQPVASCDVASWQP